MVALYYIYLGEGEPPTKFSKRGALTGSQFLKGVCSFYIKNKLKSEIFNGKKNYKQKYFSIITKNKKWEVLTKNSKNLVAEGKGGS